MKLNLLAAASLALVLAAPVVAGPPILCNPIQIAAAKSLPMGSSPSEGSPGCSVTAAIDETLAILRSDASPLVRMETIRRATVYVAKDDAMAKDLLSRVMALVLDAQSGELAREGALALFDAGFLATCYGEMGLNPGWKPGAADGLPGYAWIKAAIARMPAGSTERAEMEFGAALATHPLDHVQPGIRAVYDGHLQRAQNGAKCDSLLTANIEAHHAKWDASLAKLGSEHGKKDDGKTDPKK